MTFWEGISLLILSPALVLVGIIGLLLVFTVAAAIVEIVVLACKGIALATHDWRNGRV